MTSGGPELVRRWRAWAPTGKAAALFLLPISLYLAFLAALVAGDLQQVLLTAGGLGCFWTAGVLAARALAGEARYVLGERPNPPVIPLKLLSAGLTTIGVLLAATAAGYDVAIAVVFALLALSGHVAFYGRDLRAPRIRVAFVDGIDVAVVTAQLKQAYSRLRGIEAVSQAIPVLEFRDRLSHITGIGRAILREIERDPADAARARRFLNLYLDEAERITAEYARAQRALPESRLDDSFRQLLDDLERTFEHQRQRLVNHERMSLDADIEVLSTRLKREGLG
jgi:5-bromo-4-chloroindolyl phosphate hydrolysis protein